MTRKFLAWFGTKFGLSMVRTVSFLACAILSVAMMLGERTTSIKYEGRYALALLWTIGFFCSLYATLEERAKTRSSRKTSNDPKVRR